MEVGNPIGFIEYYFSLLVFFLRWADRQFKFYEVLISIHLLVIKNLEDRVA